MDEKENFNPEFNRLRFCMRDDKISKKIFWISHSSDGSMMIEIPYSKTGPIYFGKFALPRGGPPIDVNYAEHGIESNICPKFVYHASGICHFSKTGSIGSKFCLKGPPLRALVSGRAHVFTFLLNGIPKSFEDFDESKTKRKDLKEKNYNVVFGAPFISLRKDVRHRFKCLIEPAKDFYSRHDLKPDRHFYKTSDGGAVYVYNLTSNDVEYKVMIAYKEYTTGQFDEHFVFFGSTKPNPDPEVEDVLFIVGNR